MEPMRAISPAALTGNTFRLIGTDWMLVTAGAKNSFNTMTASWGGLGFLWNRNVSFIFVRPQRHTYSFLERHDIFTLSFFDETYRNVLQYCGSKSGKDVDKVSETKITPAETGQGGIYFSEARLMLECRKIYYQDIIPENFLDQKIADNYSLQDYHRMYIGEIVTCLSR
ncbi:MAG TPA: flavin reductase [Spirochaetota bacterium]|nr:flavin reductase [Spirochaetota bacterium]